MLSQRIIFLLFISFAIYSCSNESQKNKISLKDSTIENSVNPPQNVFIKDSSDYSKKFISNIIEYNTDDLKFIDSLLIVGNDTALMPLLLPLNKQILFTGCDEDNTCYKLEAKRINYSTIKYTLEKNSKRIKCYNESGFADLDHNFYYLDKDDEYENEIKYTTITPDSCSFTIRIGTNTDNILCAKLERSFCKNEANDVYNAPALYRITKSKSEGKQTK
jgi:hypothetical protein